MNGPIITSVLLAILSALLLFRAGRRIVRDEPRHSSNPREVRLSIAMGALMGLFLFGLLGASLAIFAGLSRYRAAEGPDRPSLTVKLEPEGGRLRIAWEGIGMSPSMAPSSVDEGWFSILAQKVSWRGPLRWIGFPDSLRPCAILSAKTREDLVSPDRIRRQIVSPENSFERLLKGPAAGLGLWSFEEVRTPWRPAKPGPMECFFIEQGPAQLER